MNMAAGIVSAQCPKCHRSTGHWIEPRMLHVCGSCGVPLIRFRVSRKIRLYRIIPVTDLIRIAGSLVTISAIISAVAIPGGMRAAVFMVATALVAFGVADVSQEVFGMRAKRRPASAIIGGQATPSWKSAARLAIGLTCFMLGIVGFMVWASVSTEM